MKIPTDGNKITYFISEGLGPLEGVPEQRLKKIFVRNLEEISVDRRTFLDL